MVKYAVIKHEEEPHMGEDAFNATFLHFPCTHSMVHISST